MCSDLYLPAMPNVMEYYQTAPSAVQASLTASFLGLAIGQLVIGPVSDAYGRLLPLFISLVFFTVTSFLCTLAPNIQLFIAIRFMQGLAASGGIVLTRSIACDQFRGNELTSFMSFLMSINSLAPILAPIIGSFIISFAPWQVLFYVLAVWGLSLILATWAFIDESHPKSARVPDIKSSLSLVKIELVNSKFMLMTVSLASIMGGFFSYLSASPFVFQIIYMLSPVEYSFTFAFISICISVVSASAGILSRKFGEKNVVWFAYFFMFVAAMAILIEAFFPPDSFIPVLLTLALFCSMMGLSQSAGFGLVMSVKRGGAGAASGLFGVIFFLFGSLVSPFVGIMGENSMIPLGINLVTCVILAMILMKIAIYVKTNNNLSDRNKGEGIGSNA